MKSKLLTQIVLVMVGLVDLAMIYFLYLDLRHSSWHPSFTAGVEAGYPAGDLAYSGV